VLANLFLHYAFDAWLTREFPRVTFERYVDDAVVHCVSRRQAEQVAEAIGNRMEAVGCCPPLRVQTVASSRVQTSWA
jgi:retron-type reverse transcriptase